MTAIETEIGAAQWGSEVREELYVVYCSVAVYTCLTPNKVRCHTVLSSLQTNRYFENCVCNPADPGSTDCLDTQKRIFLHSCVIHEGNSLSNA